MKLIKNQYTNGKFENKKYFVKLKNILLNILIHFTVGKLNKKKIKNQYTNGKFENKKYFVKYFNSFYRW